MLWYSLGVGSLVSIRRLDGTVIVPSIDRNVANVIIMAHNAGEEDTNDDLWPDIIEGDDPLWPA
jgi:hypothetical protein